MTGRGRARGRGGRGRGSQEGGPRQEGGRRGGGGGGGGDDGRRFENRQREPGPRSYGPPQQPGPAPPRLSAWNTPRQQQQQQQQQPPPYQMPAPLQVQERQAAAAVQPQPAAPISGSGDAATAVPPGSGRASYRGGANQTTPGIEKLSSEFSKLSFRRMRDENVHSRPANIAVSDKQGGAGKSLDLYCNYFDILTMPAYSLHHYHVTFAPEVEGKKVRKALLEQHSKKYFGDIYLFDGMMLFLPKQLPDTLELTSRSDITNIVHNITITWRCKVMRTSPIIIQLLNILYKQMLMSLNLVQIGRNYYSVPKQFDQESKLAKVYRLSILDGIQSSILNYERGAMLCVDISHKVMRLDTVADIMLSCKIKINSPGWKEAILRRLLGRIVLTRYNNRTYRIDDIDMNMLPTRTFLKHNTPISFVDYYKNNYGVQIRYTNLPMLLSKPKARDIRRGQNTPIYLVPELVAITGLEDEVRTNFDIMRDLAQSTRLTPDTRIDRLQKFIQKTRQNPEASKLVAQWDLELSEKLAKIPARVLEPEKIMFDGKCINGEENAEWSGPMRGMPLHKTTTVKEWLLIYPFSYSRMAGDFEECLKRVAAPLNIKYQEPIRCETRDVDPSGQAYIASIKENVVASTQLVVALVHDNAKSRYDAIKKFCSIDPPAGRPIPSQVVVQRSLTKKNTFMSVATKIAIQINCKLGGIPWLVQLPLTNYMIVGIDHYHDSAKKGHSVGGIVASMNKDLTQWYSRTTFQTAHEELSSKLQIMMQMLLKRYSEVNSGRLPDRVFVYRDGVGDGQLNVLVNYEVKQYTDAFQNLAPNHNFKLTVIIVKKRINTRLFLENKDCGQTIRRGPSAYRDTSRWKNPVPGTIVDRDIVRNEWYDFFVVSQSVRQGTVSPTHYNVIFDKSGLKPDHLQKLTYKMCHLYYNWPGTIRVPAPCQYAHKLAFLVGQSIHREPAVVLQDKLFYL